MNEMILWSPGVTLDQIEREVILKAFQFYKCNKTATSISLGIAIRTLEHKLEKYKSDGERQSEIHEQEKQRREDFQLRQRGIIPPIRNQDKKTTESVSSSNAGVCLESTAKASTQQTMSVPERAQVQAVLSKHAPQSSARKHR